MRHLTGLILAIALAAALYLAAGWGIAHLYATLYAAVAPGHHLISTTGLLALSALVGTGLLLGILLAVRAISPLATGLPGLGLLAWTALLAMNPHRALGWVPLPGHAFGFGFRLLLASGALAALGAAMIVPLFLPSRWRGSPAEEDEDEDEADPALPAVTGLAS